MAVFNSITMYWVRRNTFLALVAAVALGAACRQQASEVPPAPVASESEGSASEEPNRSRILFFGDSITAGYGIDPRDAFPALIQQKIDSLGLAWEVVPAGLSGETTAGGLRRIDWILRSPVDVAVIELGGNDGLRGVPADDIASNLSGIIDRLREKNQDVQILLAGMKMPPNLGGTYTKSFDDVFPTVAKEKDVQLIPFILDDVGGVAALNQPDGIHPTAAGHKLIAETVWRYLRDLVVT